MATHHERSPPPVPPRTDKQMGSEQPTKCPRRTRRSYAREKRRIAPEEDEVVEDGVEFSGRTVEEAIAQAETYFGGSRDQLQVTVITQGRGGVFGIGAEPARIKVQPPAAAPAEADTSQPAVR